GDPVPLALSEMGALVAEGAECHGGKRLVADLRLLQAGDVGLHLGEPGFHPGHPHLQRVHVPRRDAHRQLAATAATAFLALVARVPFLAGSGSSCGSAVPSTGAAFLRVRLAGTLAGSGGVSGCGAGSAAAFLRARFAGALAGVGSTASATAFFAGRLAALPT